MCLLLFHAVTSFAMTTSSYQAPFLYRNAHIHTILPNLIRKVANVSYRRERIATPDDDFLDLDWSEVGGETVAVIAHGLEGNSKRSYVLGMGCTLNAAGISAVAWNFRGCSGAANRQLRLYHNGAIDDVHTVVAHAARRYPRVVLVGFSMGGNMNLLYLGKQASALPEQVAGCAVFSVPCDLTDAAIELERRANTIYMKRFLKLLHEKVRMKQVQFPQAIDDRDYRAIKNFKQFDDRYTAPLHGFAGAEDYWEKCSCRPWLSEIGVPTLIVNAADDPFLGGGCYPVAECAANPQIALEIPRHGGHVGFVHDRVNGRYWSEERTVEFIRGLE